MPIHFDIMFKKLKKSGDLKPESGDREKCSNVLKIREISRIFGRFGTSGVFIDSLGLMAVDKIKKPLVGLTQSMILTSA